MRLLELELLLLRGATSLVKKELELDIINTGGQPLGIVIRMRVAQGQPDRIGVDVEGSALL